jgi:hypothetical protein
MKALLNLRKFLDFLCITEYSGVFSSYIFSKAYLGSNVF